MIIAIDGPSGTGKSTVAKRIAEKLCFDYLETGAMYRALAYQMLQSKLEATDLEGIEVLCTQFNFHSKCEEGKWRFYVGQEEITDAIRSNAVAHMASQIAAHAIVRKAMASLQRQHGEKGNLVCEGRDIGTVIFPDAEVKIFLTADAGIRAERRQKELQKKFPGQHFDLEKVKSEVIERDAFDANRDLAPLTQASDAVVVDTSNMTIDQVVQTIVAMVKQ